MMKTVLALGVGAAVDRGLLALDTPIARHIPAWANDPRGAITVRHLLTMHSGLAHAPFSLNPYSRYMQSWLSADVNAAALASPQAQPPGSQFQYTNVAYQLLAMVLENATRRRLADWLGETVWAPAGARTAALWLDREGGAARGFCCLVATAQDWLRVGLVLKDAGAANGKQVVSQSWVDAMQAPSPSYANYGMGVWRATPYTAQRSYGPGVSFTVPAAERFAADDMIYSDGNGGQRVYVSRDAGVVIVRIGAPRMDWDDAALPNIVLRGLRPGGGG
jgi:CubicO group peptidase (beta-lactamase class C family)